jgi:hypothetical protein
MEKFARLFEVDNSQVLVTVEPDGPGAEIVITTKIDGHLIRAALDTMPVQTAMAVMDSLDNEDVLKRLEYLREAYQKAMA